MIWFWECTWQLAFHSLCLIVAYVDCAFLVRWPFAVNHLLIPIVTLGRWWCHSYFIDEETGPGRLIDLFTSHTQRVVEHSVLPWQSDCTGVALTTRLYFHSCKGSSRHRAHVSALSYGEAPRRQHCLHSCVWGQNHLCQNEGLLWASAPACLSLACPINLATSAPSKWCVGNMLILFLLIYFCITWKPIIIFNVGPP